MKKMRGPVTKKATDPSKEVYENIVTKGRQLYWRFDTYLGCLSGIISNKYSLDTISQGCTTVTWYEKTTDMTTFKTTYTKRYTMSFDDVQTAVGGLGDAFVLMDKLEEKNRKRFKRENKQ